MTIICIFLLFSAHIMLTFSVPNHLISLQDIQPCLPPRPPPSRGHHHHHHHYHYHYHLSSLSLSSPGPAALLPVQVVVDTPGLGLETDHLGLTNTSVHLSGFYHGLYHDHLELTNTPESPLSWAGCPGGRSPRWST